MKRHRTAARETRLFKERITFFQRIKCIGWSAFYLFDSGLSTGWL